MTDDPTSGAGAGPALPQRQPVTPVDGTPPPYGHTVSPLPPTQAPPVGDLIHAVLPGELDGDGLVYPAEAKPQPWTGAGVAITARDVRRARDRLLLAGQPAPYTLGNRIPFDSLSHLQKVLVFEWLVDRGVDPAQVDSGSLIEADRVHAEWRIGLRRPDGTYVVVRRADPRLRVATRRRDWMDLTPYLQNPGNGKVWFAPGGRVSNPTMSDLMSPGERIQRHIGDQLDAALYAARAAGRVRG